MNPSLLEDAPAAPDAPVPGAGDWDDGRSGVAQNSTRIGLPLVTALVITLAMAVTYRFVPDSHFQTEECVIRANAARAIAEWFPYYSENFMMVASPALAASGTLLPGVWIYHAGAMLLFGTTPAAQFLAALILLWACALSVGSLAALVFDDRRAAWAGLVFGLYPALADLPGVILNGPALLALFWVLQAGIRYRGFVQSGGMYRLITTSLMIFLAASTDRLGMFGVALVAAVEVISRARDGRAGIVSRLAFVSATAIPAIFFGLAVARARLPVGENLHTEAIAGWTDAIRALLWVFKGAVLPGLTGTLPSLVAVLAGSAVFISGVYRALEDFRKLALVLLMLVGTALSLGDFIDPAMPTPASPVAHLPIAVCAALILGDWMRTIRRPAVVAAVVIAYSVFFSILDAHRSMIPVERGRRVAMVADELERIYSELSDEADIYLLDDGVDRNALLTGHLDFVYRYGVLRQTRWSYVMGGMLFPGSPNSPVGRLGAVTRLEVTKSMVFVGWRDLHEGLANLTGPIRERLAIAEKVMDKSGRMVEPFPIGGDSSVKGWVPQLSPEFFAAGSAHLWFLEAPVIRLHATIGRHAPESF